MTIRQSNVFIKDGDYSNLSRLCEEEGRSSSIISNSRCAKASLAMTGRIQANLVLIFSCLFLPFFFSACDMQENVEIQLPPHKEEVIVECYLEPGMPYRALITRSVDFFESDKLKGVDGARVIISSPEGDIELTNMLDTDTSYQKIFNYGHPDTVKFEEGAEYQLTVEIDGTVKASGRTTFLPKVAFGNYELKYDADTLAALYLEVEDNPAEENYYRLVIRGTQPEFGTTSDDIWNDQTAENGKLMIYTPYRLEVGWTCVINLYHIDRQYYEFLESVQKARDANYNPFMQPATVQSALDGATGIFSSISLTSDTIKIPPR